MRRATLIFAGCALLLAAPLTEARAQSLRGLQGRIDLTDEQKTALEELRTRQREAALEARAEMIKAQAEVRALMVDPDRDLGALERALRKQADLQIANRIRMLKNRKAYRALLTEEQLAKLDSLRRRAVVRGARRALPGRARAHHMRFGRGINRSAHMQPFSKRMDERREALRRRMGERRMMTPPPPPPSKNS